MQKSIYGLRQAPQAWYEKFTSKLLDLGFLLSVLDLSLFIKCDNRSITYLLLYVDNIIITCNNSIFINSFIHQLGQHFKTKGLGPLKYFLCMEAHHRTNNGLFLFQTKYITDLLMKSDIVGCKPVGSLASKEKLSPSNGPLLDDPTQLWSIVGAFQYVSLTSPDISYVVNQVCQFMCKPTVVYMTTAKRILQFLKGTLTYGFHFCLVPLRLYTYCDADWAGSPFE